MVRFTEVLFFTKHLSVMLKSGITIVEALHILEEQNKSTSLKKVIHEVIADIQNGQSLAKAMGKHPKVFNQLYVSLISIGEETGKLDDGLVYLAQNLAKEHAFRQKVRGALAYPVVVLIAALGVGIGISLFVLPRLLDLFTGIDIKLPLATQILLGFSAFMRDFGVIAVILLVLFIFLLRFLFIWPTTKPFFDRFTLGLPFFGRIAQEIQLTLLFRSISVMLKSGITIPTALDIEAKAIGNDVYKGYMKRLLDSVTRGKSLSSEFETKTYPQIPLIAVKMIAVGEQTGKLDETFMYLADYFEESVDDTVKNMTTLLEPVLLMVIGVIVGFVALSIIAPIYSLTGSINP